MRSVCSSFGDATTVVQSVPITTALILTSAHFPNILRQHNTPTTHPYTKKMKLLLAAAALMAGVSAKPGTIRINKAKGKSSPVIRSRILCYRSIR